MERMMVDFPAPLAPIKHTASRAPTSRSIPLSTFAAPRDACRPVTSSTIGRLSEIGFDHNWIDLHLLGRALADQFAIAEHDDLVRQLHNDPHIVFDQYDRGPGAIEIFHDLRHPFD